MATGVYGTNKLASVTTSDIDIFYTYAQGRDLPPTLGVQKLDANQVITRFQSPDANPDGSIPFLDGLYNLQLPVSNFSAKGIYNIIITPKYYNLNITDCGILSAFPDIKGIVIDSTQINMTLEDMVGSRVEYFDENGLKTGKFTIITSANFAEPVTQNLPNSTQKSISYRYNESSNLVFCTVTPSSAPTTNPSSFPPIGSPNQLISITKGNFNPIHMEVEMVEHDIETLTYGIFGNQSKGIQDGKYTIYNFENEIYKQYNLYEVQDEFTGEPLYEIREETDDIDETKDFDDITDFPTRN
jgi:hypothetical protein